MFPIRVDICILCFLQGLTPPPFFPSERKGTKKAVFLVFFLKKESKIKKKVEVVAEFVYATANKKGQDRPVFCVQNTIHSLNFFKISYYFSQYSGRDWVYSTNDFL